MTKPIQPTLHVFLPHASDETKSGAHRRSSGSRLETSDFSSAPFTAEDIVNHTNSSSAAPSSVVQGDSCTHNINNMTLNRRNRAALSAANRKSISRFQSCPLCSKSFPNHLIESHAATCTGGCGPDSNQSSSPTSPGCNDLPTYNIPAATNTTSPSVRLWQQIQCPICRHICVKAHMANPCGHISCASCISSQGQQLLSSCPLCHDSVLSFTWLRPYDDMIRSILLCQAAKPEPNTPDTIPIYMQKFIQAYDLDGFAMRLTSQERDFLSNLHKDPIVDHSPTRNPRDSYLHSRIITDEKARYMHWNESPDMNSSNSSKPDDSSTPNMIVPVRLHNEEKVKIEDTHVVRQTHPESFLTWKRPKTFLSTPSSSLSLYSNCSISWSEPLPGLFVFPDFITPGEEMDILGYLDGETTIPWKMASFNGPHLGKRWGVHCNLRDRKVSAAETPLPGFFHQILLPKVRALLTTAHHLPPPLISLIQQWNANEANAIRYHKKMGHCLASHCDDRKLSKELIANLSLEGDCYMTYQNEKYKDHDQKQLEEHPYKQESMEKNQETKSPEILIVPGRKSEGVPFVQIPSFHNVLLKRRTLQLLTGRARYDYSHGIRNEHFIDETRVSITMRESPIMK